MRPWLRWRSWMPFAAVLVLSALSGTARADGIPAYYDQTGWHLLREQTQQAFISLRDGQETLLLEVALDAQTGFERAQRLAWLTPVPAQASAVQVDVLRGFPSMRGVRPGAALASDARAVMALMAVSQLYPIPLLTLFVVMRSAELSDGVHVRQTVRRDGVEVELLSADTKEALAAYLRDRKVELPQEALDHLTPYVGPKASFVLYRIADLGAYLNAIQDDTGMRTWPPSMGIEIRFPAQEGFFPLVASAGLPGNQLDVLVTTLGHAVATQQAPPGLSTEHYVGTLDATAEVHRALGIEARDGQSYTRFRIRGSPSELTSDLHFQPGAPFTTRAATAFFQSPWQAHIVIAFGGALFLGLSVLSSLVARRVWSAEHRPSTTEAVWIGLANTLTVLGVLVAARAVSRKRGAPPGRAFAHTAMMSAVFCGLLLGITIVVSVGG